MKWTLLLQVWIILPQLAFSQVTFIIQNLPANTPANPSIYIAGDFNGWDPGNAAYRLQQNAQGKFQITLNLQGNILFKFTRGDWPGVEGSANGGEIANRSAQVQAGQTLYFDVLSWKDLGVGEGTALPTVKLLHDNFFMPGLNTTRRIWICLPPDYDTNTAKRYPVVYMHDGQNLFDERRAFLGQEWKVDETMKALFDNGDRGAIVVGIENGGGTRIAEYTPWVNPGYESGQGGAYAAFLAEHLKPFIDNNYRTFPEPAGNALIGSSLGGLISLYTLLQYPEAFGKAGVFSPAFWINKEDLFSWERLSQSAGKWVYLVCGSNESSSMVPDMQQMRDLLVANEVADISYHVVSGGAHNEIFWASVYGEAYTWLFRDRETLGLPNHPVNQQVFIFPCPFSSSLSVKKHDQEILEIRITDMAGRTMIQRQLGLGEEKIELNLPAGIYQLHATGNRGSLYNSRIICQP